MLCNADQSLQLSGQRGRHSLAKTIGDLKIPLGPLRAQSELRGDRSAEDRAQPGHNENQVPARIRVPQPKSLWRTGFRTLRTPGERPGTARAALRRRTVVARICPHRLSF